MTPKELAEKMNGRQYANEMAAGMDQVAKDSGLVIVYGASDDLCEFEGAIVEEIGCWNGGKIFFNSDGTNFTDEDGEGVYSYHDNKELPEANMIEAVWCEKEKVFHPGGDYYSWAYKTSIPHETFDIMEDNEPYCRGIVFSISDLK